MPIHESQACQQLFDQGFQHLEHLHQVLHGFPMAKTCYEATIPDSALISPSLIPYLKGIRVNKDKLFDCHDPVEVYFSLPGSQLFQLRISMPKPWTQLPVEAAALQDLVNRHGWPQCNTLSEWGDSVEHLVDCVIRQQHAEDPAARPLRRLPKAYKGRCKTIAPKKIPLQSQVKKGRVGDYEPPGEVYALPPKDR